LGISDEWNPPFSLNGDLQSKNNRKGGIINQSLKRIGIRRYRNMRLDHPSRNEYDPSFRNHVESGTFNTLQGAPLQEA